MYQFQLEHTLEDREVVSRFLAKTIHRKSMLIRRTLYGIYAASFFILGTLNSLWQRWVLVALYMVAGLFFAVLTIFYHPLTARRMQRNAPKGLGTITVWLEETGIRAKHTKEESFSPYEAYDGVFYYRERYFLTSDRAVALLPERALVEGDSATLKDFFEEKLQQEVIEIP